MYPNFTIFNKALQKNLPHLKLPTAEIVIEFLIVFFYENFAVAWHVTVLNLVHSSSHA